MDWLDQYSQDDFDYSGENSGADNVSAGITPDESYMDYGNFDWSNNSWYDYSGNTGGIDLSNPNYNFDYSGDRGVDLSNPNYNFDYTQPTSNPFGSISTTLSSIFNNPNAMKMGAAGLSALLEGSQNKKKAAAMQKSVQQIDPWASQRPFYQQQAQQAVTNPYDSPIVKAQIEQLQQAQNIKDAAAGRRSNSLTSSPAVMAEMAKIAQAYQAQMANQGGATIQPSGLAQTLGAASTYDTNGYISPLLTAAGYGTKANALDNLTAEQKKLLGQQWANA